MSSSLALAICVGGIAALFYLDRDKSQRTSNALWIPIAWLLIIGSRPVSVWLGMSPPSQSAAQAAEGSPFDAAIFGALLAAGIVVLILRGKRLNTCLTASSPCLIYFGYCLLSVLWSDSSEIAFKRWIKAIGDLVMVMVVVTDAEPLTAIGRFITRSGFVLMPASILLIKYFGNLGRGYDPDGVPMNTGVTTNKNILGVITLVISLGAVWRLLDVMLTKRRPNRVRYLVARITLLVFCVAVLALAQSATSIACFVLGTTLIVVTNLPVVRNRPGRVHALVAMILVAGGIAMLFGGGSGVVHALGRNTNFTGRTEIWAAVLAAGSNPIFGAGFESFWMGPTLDKVYSHLSQYMHVNEAHDGYLEVYLNLGWIGVSLIGTMLISGYRGAVAAFRRSPAIGSLMLAYIAAAAIYSVTEAGFRMLDPIWMFLLLAVSGSHSAASGAGGGIRKQNRRSAFRIDELPAGHELTSSSTIQG